MSWAAVSWAYKDVITSAKLAQMQENVRSHDHRADGTQGGALKEIASGTATLPTSAIGVTASTVVNFPAGRFTAAPKVVLQESNNYGSADLHLWVTAVTTTSFTLNQNRETTAMPAGQTVDWQAMNTP